MHGKILEISPWYLWCDAVMAVATRAKMALPQCAGRVEKAMQLALAGEVRLLEDGTALVASQSNPTLTYHVVAGRCECPDAPKAPSGLCKHRLAVAIATRAYHAKTHSTASLAERANGHQPTPSTGIADYTAVVEAVKDGFTVLVTVQKPHTEQTAFYAALATLPAHLREQGYTPCLPITPALGTWWERLLRPAWVLLLLGLFLGMSLCP